MTAHGVWILRCETAIAYFYMFALFAYFKPPYDD